MNRRIVIIDDVTKDINIKVEEFVGLGYPNLELYKMSILCGKKENDTVIPGLPEEALFEIFGNLGESDGAMLCGPAAFGFLQRYYHFGVRGENYYECSKLRRLGTNAGFYVAAMHHDLDFPLDKQYFQFFMSPDFTRTRVFGNYEYVIVKTHSEALKYIAYFFNLQEKLGFDYEGSGLAFDKNYKITGVGVAKKTEDDGGKAAFFSFTDIRRSSSPQQWEDFLEKFRGLLIKNEQYWWVYNAGYEAQVTWRCFSLELDFKDASVFNYIQGSNEIRYSLKYSTQRVLGGGTRRSEFLGERDLGGIIPWDTDFDLLEKLLSEMFWFTIKRPKKEGGTLREPKCDIQTYTNTQEWAEICKRYPEYIQEFKELIEDPENFGNPFLCIPSDILGKYCCLDAFYTVLIPYELEGHYSDLCIDTYLGNLSLGQKLTRGGLYINDDFRNSYGEYCDCMMLYGIIFSAQYLTYIQLLEHQKRANKLEKYPEICQILLKKGIFFGGNAIEITKAILLSHIDTNGFYSEPIKYTTDRGKEKEVVVGLDQGKLLLDFGPDFASWLIQDAADRMFEIKFKGSIDAKVGGKKKLIGLLADDIKTKIGLSGLTLGTKHEELEKLMECEKGMKILDHIASQCSDPSCIPDTIDILGSKVSRGEAIEYILKNWYMCSSPIWNEYYEKLLIDRFKLETTWLASIGKEKNKMDGEKKFYKKRGLLTPAEGYLHWENEYRAFWAGPAVGKEWPAGFVQEYPGDIWLTSQNNWENPYSDAMRDIWGSWKGYDIQDDFFGISKDWNEIKIPFTPDFLGRDSFQQMRILLIRILLYKKYSKIRSTYINGLFNDGARYVIDTPQLMPIRNADPDEPGAVKKVFVKADVLLKETKRWSSGYHTIPSHMDAKKCVTTPVLIDPVTGKKTATFLSYFDISSAEVRTLAYKSGDENLIGLFESGQDVYIHTAIAHLGKDKWESLEKGEKKAQRKIFKVVFLAVAYRMSAKTLGANLNVSEADAQALINTLFNEFPTLKGFIEARAAYPEKHDGLINTFLGDHLQCTDWKHRWTTDKHGRRIVDRSKVAKCQRAGINYSIQNYSAVSLANGFNNVQIKAKEQGFLAKNVIVVHDSCENLVSINQLFDILGFYMNEFMEYCYSLYGIRFMFDLEVGIDYGDMLSLSQPEPDVIQLKGKGSVLLEMIRRIYEESDLKVEIDTPLEQIQPDWIEDPIDRFIDDRQCCMIKDKSEYSVKIKRIK